MRRIRSHILSAMVALGASSCGPQMVENLAPMPELAFACRGSVGHVIRATHLPLQSASIVFQSVQKAAEVERAGGFSSDAEALGDASCVGVLRHVPGGERPATFSLTDLRTAELRVPGAFQSVRLHLRASAEKQVSLRDGDREEKHFVPSQVEPQLMSDPEGLQPIPGPGPDRSFDQDGMLREQVDAWLEKSAEGAGLALEEHLCGEGLVFESTSLQTDVVATCRVGA